MMHRGDNGSGYGFGNDEVPSISFPDLSGTYSISVDVGEMNYLNLFKRSGGV